MIIFRVRVKGLAGSELGNMNFLSFSLSLQQLTLTLTLMNSDVGSSTALTLTFHNDVAIRM